MTTLLINVSVCVRGRVFPSIFFRCYVYLPLSLSFFLSLSLSLSLYTHIYTSFMIFSTDDIAKYHEYINSQGNDKTIHIKHIHKTYPYPQNIPAFFLSNFFWLRLQEPAVFSWAWMVARSSMKALRFGDFHQNFGISGVKNTTKWCMEIPEF